MSERNIPARGKRVVSCKPEFNSCVGCDRPALKLLNKYVRKDASVKWHDLGLELLEQEDEGTLNEIQKNNPYNASECCKEMFQLWLNKCPNATWNLLIDALREPNIELNSLATTTEHMLMPTESISYPNTGMLNGTSIAALVSLYHQ